MKLSDIIHAKIASRIQSGEYAVESRLPTENDLAETLGVSRPIVREALARLRNDGIVVSRRGSGTYVQRAEGIPARELTPLTSIADMRRCLEFRLSLEGECAWHAAVGSEEDRGPLEEAMIRLTDDVGKNLLEPEHDFDFHHSIAFATGNRFFHETMSSMRPTILTFLQITPSFVSPHSEERLSRLYAEHKAIYAAIVAGDPEAARDAMRNHLDRAMRRVFEGL